MTSIPLRNIYVLLAYAARDVGLLRNDDIGHCEAGDEFDILARLLDTSMRRVFRRGLHKRYTELEEQGSSPRGALDLSRTVSQLLHVRGELAFRVDERLPDTSANQVLRAALRFAMASPRISGALKRPLRAHAGRLSGVSDIPPRRAAALRPPVPRGLNGYRGALRVAQLCLARALPDEGAAGQAWSRLLNDERQMGLLFEGFVRGFARVHLGDRARVGGKEFRWPNSGFSPRGASLVPKMITDVFVSWVDAPPTIFECKFYSTPFVRGPHGGPSRLHSSHLYQLMAYLRAARREYNASPSGMLVYATVDESVSEQMVLDGFQLGIVTLNLAKPWSELRGQMSAALDSAKPKPPVAPALQPTN